MKIMSGGFDIEDANPIYYYYDDDRRTVILDMDWCFMLLDDLFEDGVLVITSDNSKDLYSYVLIEIGIDMLEV